MSLFDFFTIVFAILIVVGMVLMLRRRSSMEEHSRASLGLAVGLGLGGAVGLIFSRIAGTFVYILPVSLGAGMAFGWVVGWAVDFLIQKE